MLDLVQLIDSIENYDIDKNAYNSFCDANDLNDFLCFIMTKYNILKPLKYKIIEETIIRDKGYKTKKIFQICDLLYKNKIDYCLVKGPILSFLLYDSYFLRDYDDYDLIIKKQDYVKAIRLLFNEGFVHPFLNSVPKFYNRSLEQQNRIIENIDGDDVALINIKENIAFEIKSCFRYCDSSISDYLFNNTQLLKYQNYNVSTLSITHTFILCVINLYYCFFTDYGVFHKFKYKYIFELCLFLKLNAESIQKDIVQQFIEHFKMKYIFEHIKWLVVQCTNEKVVLDFFDNLNAISIFGNEDLEKLLLDKEYRLNVFNTYIHSITKFEYPVYLEDDFYPKKVNFKHKLYIARTFTSDNIDNYLNYTFFETQNAFHIFARIDRKLDEYSLVIKISNFIYNYNLSYITKYSNDIIEVNSDLPIYRYMTNLNNKGFINFYLSINKNEIERYIQSKSFLVKLTLYKVMVNYDKNVLLIDDFKNPWHKIVLYN